jgi:predicted ester cyclase
MRDAQDKRMNTPENRAIHERFVREVIEQGQLERIDDLVSENAMSHSPMPGQAPGREGLKHSFRQFHAAFGNRRVEIRDVIAEGDKVVGYFTVSAVHQGDFMGIPATGENIQYDEMAIVRIEGGKITEHWAVADTFAMLQKIGATKRVEPVVDTHPNLIPIAQAQVIKQFFDEYAERFNRSLAGEHIEARDVAGSFAEHFVEASPAGVNGGKNGMLFRWLIPAGMAHYKKIGTTRMNIDNVDVETIDPMHALAKVHWDSSYEKDGKSEHIEFDVTYLLHFEGAKPKIFAYITGDEAKILREHGLS